MTETRGQSPITKCRHQTFLKLHKLLAYPSVLTVGLNIILIVPNLLYLQENCINKLSFVMNKVLLLGQGWRWRGGSRRVYLLPTCLKEGIIKKILN